MDLLLIIYIFVLFVIFSPNFIFQSAFKNHMIQTLVHGLLFSLLFYITYSQIGSVEKEGATIGTYELNPDNVKYDIEMSTSSLGSLVPIEKDLINFNLLTLNEKNYLFKYHLEVYSKISKFLNKKEKKWLASFI